MAAVASTVSPMAAVSSSLNISVQPPKIRLLSGPEKGLTVDLQEGKNVVGRSEDCKVKLTAPGVSKNHACISYFTTSSTGQEDACFIEDLGSTNKSLLGSLEQPVELEPGQQYPLEHGDVIVFGDAACVFLWQYQAPSTSRSLARSNQGGMSNLMSTSGRMRPQSSAMALPEGVQQEDVINQLESLMAEMNTLYSIVHGQSMNSGINSMGQSNLQHRSGMRSPVNQASLRSPVAASRPGHASVNFTSTRRSPIQSPVGAIRSQAPSARISSSMGDNAMDSTMHSKSFENILDESVAGGWQQQRQAHLTAIATPSRASTGIDRSGVNLQGTGASSTNRPPELSLDAPVPGLMRHAQLAPEHQALHPSDFEHLYQGVTRSRTARTGTSASRQGHKRAGGEEIPMVQFGRFALPENCVINILLHCARIPSVLLMAGVNAYFRRITTSDVLWTVLDLSWDTFSPDPICMRITDEILSDILARMYRTMLRNVNLSGCSFVSDWTLHLLSKYSFDVEEIDLRCHADIGPNITDAGMTELARRIPRLEEMDLGWCIHIGNVSISSIAENCPNLTSLDLTGCANVSDLALMKLADSQCGPRLHNLQLRSCELLTGDSVATIAHRCTSLQTMGLAGCERVRGDAVVALMSNCTQLVNLDITQCHQVADMHLRQMAVQFTRIEILHMAYCRNITDDGFKDMARFCHNLHHGDLRGLRKITDASIVKLSQIANNLQKLDIRGCQALTRGAVESTARSLSHCEFVFSFVS